MLCLGFAGLQERTLRTTRLSMKIPLVPLVRVCRLRFVVINISCLTISIGSELLSREAAKAVSEEFSGGTILDETKVQVLYRILSVFTSEMNTESDSKETGKKRSHYKKSYALLVPIIRSGLESASRLDNLNRSPRDEVADADANGKEDPAWLEPLWEKLAVVLTHLLTPVRTASHGLYIPRSASLLDILNAFVTTVPLRENDRTCLILSSGVASSIDVAQSQSVIANDESKASEVMLKAMTRGGEALKVFEACFDGLCRLQPHSQKLHELTKNVLEDALPSDLTESGTEGDNELHTDIAVIVCKVISRNAGMDRLVIGIFSLLSKLISVDNEALRREASNILGRVDIGQVIEEATKRCEVAEKRAQEAEEQIQELIDEIEDLREENESLHQQILVYSTSSALT